MLKRGHLVILRQLAANIRDHPEEQCWLAALGFTPREFIRRVAALDNAAASAAVRCSVTQWGLWRQALEAVRAEPRALEFCWCWRSDDDGKSRCRNCGLQVTDTCD